MFRIIQVNFAHLCEDGKVFAFRKRLREKLITWNGRKSMRRILVIDDEQSIRTIISLLLREMGYCVEAAENGKEGIEIFHRDGDFDLVITDIRMPNMDGNEVARHIRTSARPKTPLVAVTAFPEEAQMKMFDFALIKPFKLEELRTIVRSFSAGGLSTEMRVG